MNTEPINKRAIGQGTVAYGDVVLARGMIATIALLGGNVGISTTLSGSVASRAALSGLLQTSLFLRDGVSSHSKLYGSAVLIPSDTQYNTLALSIKSFTVTLSIATPLQDI